MTERRKCGRLRMACALVSLAIAAASWAVEVPPGEMPLARQTHLYLLLGQPSADGLFGDDAAWRKGPPFARRLMVYDADGTWQRACSRGIEFGRWLEFSGPLHTVGLVPCAVADSAPDDWRPGSPNFTRAVRRIKAAMKDGILTGILWHGGGRAGSAEPFGETIAALRREIGAGDVVVAVDGADPYAAEAAARVPNCRLVKPSAKPLWKRFADTLNCAEDDDIVARPIPLRAYQDGRRVRVQPARVSACPFNWEWPGYQRPKDQTEIAYFVSIPVESSKPSELTLALPGDVPDDVRIRPMGVPHKVTATGNRLTVVVERPEQFSVELGEKGPTVYVFADPPFAYQHVPNEIYFGPGEHDVGVIAPTNGQTVCIDEGAVVYGTIYAYGVRDVKITGRGVIDASKLHRNPDAPSYRYVKDVLKLDDDSAARSLNCLTLYSCTNVTVEGVVMRDPARWTMLVRGHSRSVDINNVKVIGAWRYCSDGIDITSSEYVVIRNSFFRTFDDCIVLRATLEANGPTRNILVENCVLWCDWGRALEIIYDGGRANPLVENVLYRNVKIVGTEGTACSIQSRASLATFFRNIRYENLEVDFPPRWKAQYQARHDARFVPTLQTEGSLASIWAARPKGRDGKPLPPEPGKEVLFERIAFDGVKIYGETNNVKVYVAETGPSQNLKDVTFRNVPDGMNIIRKSYEPTK